MTTLTPEQLAANTKANNIANYGAPTGSISADSLTAPDPLKTVDPATDPIIASGNGIIKNALASIPTAQATVDTGTASAKTALDTITADNTKLLGKTADTQAANEAAGVNKEQTNLDTYNQQLNDINANIKGLSNEAKAIPLKVQNDFANTGATDTGVAPIQTGQLRNNAIKALTQSSLADVLTANISNSTIRLAAAKDKAQQAIDLKYQPIEAEIAQLKDQLAMNKQYITDPAEAKLAKSQETVLNARTEAINKAKTDETTVSNIKLEALKNYGGKIPSTVLDSLAGVSPDKALSIMAPYLKTNTNDVVKLDNGNTVVIDKQTGKIISTLGGASTPVDPNGTPSSVVRTVTTTDGTTKPVAGYALAQGDDPYNVAQQNGLSIDQLKALNPDVKDWTKLPVGYVLNLPNKDDAWLNGKTPEQIQAYNSIPDSEKASIKQLVNGDALLTDIVKSRGAKTQQQINDIVTKATAIDPSFSINANKQRYTYKQQFQNPNGKDQLQVTAINTALGHLAEFKTASDALGKTVILPYNQLVNFLSKNVGDPKVANLNTVITALAGELASVYKGGGAPTDQETEQWRNSILSSFSNAQTSGVASTTANLISNKMQSMNNAYKNVMGAYPTNPIIDPAQLNQLSNAGVDVSGITSKLKSQGYDIAGPEATSNYNGFTLPGIAVPSNGAAFNGFNLPN